MGGKSGIGFIDEANPLNTEGTVGREVKKNPLAAAALGGIGAGGLSGLGTVAALGAIGGGLEQKDPAAMQQYTDLANQAQQEYGRQRQFMQDNIDPKRKDLINQLAQQASGQGPSIAEAQLRGAFDKSLQQQLAMARSGRGNAGLAARNVSNVAAQQGQNLAQQSAIARMQEQQMGQQALQSAIQNEQAYATGTLGSALGSQANAAQMQQGMRDRRDARFGQVLGGIGQIAGSIFGLAEGGQVPDLEKMLKTRYTKAPKKMAYGGGAYTTDVGDVRKFVADSDAQVAKGQQGQQAAMSGLTSKLKQKKAVKTEEDDFQALDELVADMDETNQIDAQQQAVNSFVPRSPFAAALPPAPMPFGGMQQLPARTLPMSKGGNVPGKAQTPGDSLKNDKVPALLSPGEVVVPRSVIDQGHVASAYFVKKATENPDYNAKDFKAEKKSLASMLKEIQDGEEQFKKVKNIIKKGK